MAMRPRPALLNVPVTVEVATSIARTSPAGAEEALYESCYPNGFSSGALVMSGARVARDGGEAKAAAYRYTDDAKTVLLVPVADGWQPEDLDPEAFLPDYLRFERPPAS